MNCITATNYKLVASPTKRDFHTYLCAMPQYFNVYALPVEIWQQNIYPYIESTDFLNLILSNKQLYEHLTKTKRNDYQNYQPCLWNHFHEQKIANIQSFMDKNFYVIKRAVEFPLNGYQEILTICEIYRQNHVYLPNKYKILERQGKERVLNYLKSKNFANYISDIPGCCYDIHFLLLGTLDRGFYENKTKMDAHIDNVVNGMTKARMNDPEVFLKIFSNNMVLDFGNHQQQLKNILPKRTPDRNKEDILDKHSKFHVRHSNSKYIDLYSLEKLMYYNDQENINQLNILISIIFEKILNVLFIDIEYKIVWPISTTRRVLQSLSKTIFVFSVKKNIHSNERLRILVECHSHKLSLINFDAIRDDEKTKLAEKYHDVFKGSFISDMITNIEYSMKMRGDKLMQTECIYNRSYKEQTVEECLETLTRLKHEVLEEIKVKSPNFDFWNDHNRNMEINFNDISLYVDKNSLKGSVVFKDIHSKQKYAINLNLSFFMQYPVLYVESHYPSMTKTKMLDKYGEVKQLFKVYFYNTLNINYTPIEYSPL